MTDKEVFDLVSIAMITFGIGFSLTMRSWFLLTLFLIVGVVFLVL